MNSSIYLFGDFGHGITSYPNDYTKGMLKAFIDKAKAPTQLVIHRDGDIMNYGYVRQIENGNYFGICLQINGQYIKNKNKLIKLFENIIANICTRGDIIKLDKKGDIVSNCINLSDKSEDVESIREYCQTEFQLLSNHCKLLPAVDYSISVNEIFEFLNTDGDDEIIAASLRNGFRFVFKSKDFDNIALQGYRSTLATLNKENEANKQSVANLTIELAEVKKQKKQMTHVVFLMIALAVGFFVFINVVGEKNNVIGSKNRIITEKTLENDNLAQEINALSRDYEHLDSCFGELKIDCKKLENQRDSLCKENESLENKYNNLNSQYNEVKRDNNNKQKRIYTLQQKNNELEMEMSKYKNACYTKEQSYNSLQSRYNSLNNGYNEVVNKYYSTKEGKKELKKYGRRY